MATIPIEVIVQDAESPVGPTPTPVDPTDQGENTNIIVPDTGAGTADSNSGINNSSAAISIVSIIIAVLAICAAAALLVRKHYKHKKASTEEAGMTRQERRAMAATSTIAVLALTVLLSQLVVASVVSPIATNAATDDTVNDEAELDVDSKITIIATRTEDEDTTVATVKNNSTATSHQTFGYKVTASMEADATTANLYLDGDETSEYYIAPVTDDTLSNNTWGYTLAEESEDYLPIPLATDPTTIVKGYDNIEDEPVDIYYTIQVDKDLLAGTYTGTLEYTLTDNNFPSTLTTMQGMTTEICEDTFTPGNSVTDPVPTATLIDSRDNKTYTIAKLADGNCWMTQNLDLDLEMKAEGSIVYDSTNTNLLTNTTWEPERATIAKDSLSSDTWQMDNNNPYSYDPGDVYYYTSGSDVDDIKYESLEACVGANHTEAECRHYHVGNYYNWTAAIASNDSSEYTEDYQNVTTSICPAGWRLPIISGATLDENEFAVLVDKYGILGDSMPCGPGCSSKYGYAVNGFNSIRLAPIWLVRPGGINRYATIDLFNSGERGFYWSSVVGGSLLSRGFEFSFDDGMRLPGIGSRSKGSSVRCVAE